MKKIDKIIKTTEKAQLVEIENKRYWVPKKFISNGQINDEEFKLEPVDNSKIGIKVPFEDYSEKSIKLNLKLRVDDVEKEKFMFLPKLLIDIQDDIIQIEEWFWKKKCEEIIQEEIEYQKQFEEVDESGIEILGLDLI